MKAASDHPTVTEAAGPNEHVHTPDRHADATPNDGH
jgi:hypothetical protein